MKGRSWTNIAAWTIAASLLTLAGCASGPLSEQKAQALAKKPPIPRVVRLDVDCGESGLFGSSEDWIRSISEGFRDLNVCAAITSLASEHARADMTVSVILSKTAAREESQVVTVGAILDFLAWGWVPLLPLWVPDVDVHPGIQATVRTTLTDESNPPVFACPPIETCQRERFPFVSWATLGAVVLPPFVYQEPDRDYFEESVADVVRLQLACELARYIKDEFGLHRDGELVRGLEIKQKNGRWILSYIPEPGRLQEMTLRVEDGPDAPRERTIFIPYSSQSAVKPNEVDLSDLHPGPVTEGLLLHVLALGRMGERLSYSVRFPGPASDASSLEGA